MPVCVGGLGMANITAERGRAFYDELSKYQQDAARKLQKLEVRVNSTTPPLRCALVAQTPPCVRSGCTNAV